MIDPSDDEAIAAWIATIAARNPGRPATTFSYGPSPEQVVDVWPARGKAMAAPAVVSIHGGAFMAEFDRSLHDPICERLQHNGFDVYNIEYRRTGSADDPAQTIADARAAVQAVLERAAGAVVVFGHSAGGYLAQWVADLPGIALVVPLAPITDVLRWGQDADPDGCLDAWLGPRLGVVGPDRAERCRSLTIDPSSLGPAPIRIVHGERDGVVPVVHSRDQVAQAEAAGVDVALHELPGEGHLAFLDPDEQAFGALLRLLRPSSVAVRPGRFS